MTAFLCACDNKKDAPLTAYLEGDAYRGAELALYATVTQDGLSDSVTFEVTEGGAYCYIYGGKLKIRNDAMVGAAIAIVVRAGEYSQVVRCTVGATPVEGVAMTPVVAAFAGQDLVLAATLTPAYADDNPIRYVITEGADIATVEGNTLHVSPTADASQRLSVAAEAGGVRSESVLVPIATVQAQSITADVTTTLHRGESVQIQPTVTPVDANVPVACTLERSVFADAFITLVGDTLRVAEDAPEGVFDVTLTAGFARTTLHFTVEKTAVSMVVLSRLEEGDTASYGDIVTTACRVYPALATYRDVTYEVVDGAEYVEALPEEGSWRITTREVGVSVVFVATADGVSGYLRLTTIAVPVREVVLSADGATSVQVGDVRILSGQILPADATGTIDYTVVEGRHLCTLVDNVITFTQMDAGNDPVVVCGRVGDTVGYITFHVVPVPVESVTISTTDVVEGLRAGQTITFEALVLPANATYRTVTFRIKEGGAFGSISDNVFTVADVAAYGTVVVQAESADGIYSNPITLTVEPNAYQPTFSAWADLDAAPRLFDGHAAVVLDLSALPAGADECVVVVSDDVQTLTVVGRYQGTEATCFRNLYFYFLTTDSITVYLRNVGIRIDNGFTDAVLDFGGQACVTLVAENDNYIAAGAAYAMSTIGYMVEGEMDEWRLMDGMDGFAGQDGGTALMAYDLTLTGAGNLVLAGGDASSGTDATDGLSTTDPYTYAGNGGRGGNGGLGGYAIYAHSLTYDFAGSITLYAGASGTAGKGGAAGTGVSETYHGKAGRDGVAGEAHDAVKADMITMMAGRASHNMGVVRANAATRTFDTVAAGAALLAEHFKVNVIYAAGWTAGHTSAYTMTKLATTETAELLRLLHGLDYALSVMGHNVLIDASASAKVNIYLCKSIRTKGTGADIYGLTDDGNNVWYSAFETRKRDSFYSTYYNIMVHELLHVLYFQSSTATQNALGNTALSAYNHGVGYYHPGSYTISANNNANGVYDGTAAGGDACTFLTKYSKYDNKEDISETLSILCIQPGVTTFVQAGDYIYAKAMYISETLANEYAALDMWKPLAWLRYMR